MKKINNVFIIALKVLSRFDSNTADPIKNQITPLSYEVQNVQNDQNNRKMI